MKYVAKKKVKHNSCTNCPKVGFGKKIISMVNAVVHGTRPKKYECRFMAPGLTNYPGEGGKQEKWLISRETMNAMQNSFIGCPVVAETKHEAGTVPDDFNQRVQKGDYDGVITAVRTNAKDGWDWAEFIVWDPEVQDQIEKDGFNVSCAYNTVESLPGGVYNAIPYDAEVAKGEYIHMAIVRAPRQTDARIFLNSIDKRLTTKEAGAIMFAMNGVNYKLYPKGKLNADDQDRESLLRSIFNLKRLRDGTADYDTVVKALEGTTEQDLINIEDAMRRELKKNASDVLSYLESAIANKLPTDKIISDLKEKGLSEEQVQDEIGKLHKEMFKKNSPEEGKKILDSMAKHIQDGMTSPEAIYDAMKSEFTIPADEEQIVRFLISNEINRLAKKNEGGNEMEKCSKCGKLMTECNCAKENEIDPEKAIITTPEGDVPMKDMINAWKAAELAKAALVKKNADSIEDILSEAMEKKWSKEQFIEACVKAGISKEAAEKAAVEGLSGKENAAPKVGLDDEFEGVKVSDMYNAFKAAKQNAETPEEKKAREEAEAKKNADEAEAKKKADEEALAKKNADDTRRAALKEEGKTDEEAEAIMKSEAEAVEKAKKEDPPPADKEKSDLAEKEKKEKEQTNFNSIANARREFVPEVPTEKKRISKSESVKINKATKEY